VIDTARNAHLLMFRRMLLVLVAVASSLAIGQKADPLDTLFARGKAQQAEMHSIRAAFTETTISSMLRDPIVARGTVVAVMPLRVLMTYTTPEQRYVLIDDQRIVTVVPATHERQEINIAEMQKRIQKYFVEASPKVLRQSFDVTLSTDPSMRGANLLDMTPKRMQIREGLSRLRLWIDDARLMLLKMKMDYADGDTRTLELSDVEVNIPIDSRTFVIPSER
jgi:outer membrane lipoprotein-sorting protein